MKHLVNGALDDAGLCRALLAILMQRDGVSELRFTQFELDGVVGQYVLEGLDDQGRLIVYLADPADLTIERG